MLVKEFIRLCSPDENVVIRSYDMSKTSSLYDGSCNDIPQSVLDMKMNYVGAKEFGVLYIGVFNIG